MPKFLFTKLLFVYSIILQGQVQVRDEPRHHNVFENEFIRILDVHLGPKDTTQYHLHNTPSVFIFLTNSKVSSQLWGGKPQSGANVSGNISYDSMNIPRTHRVWNEDTLWFHVMDVELISKEPKNSIKVIQNPSLKLMFNEKQVNGYTAEIKPSATLDFPPSASGYLLVSKETGSISLITNKINHYRLLKPGHYLWIEPGKDFSIRSNDISTLNFVILQMK